jgi:integrase
MHRVLAFMASLSERMTAGTMDGYAAAINKWHKEKGIDSPLSAQLLQDTLAKCRKDGVTRKGPGAKAPITGAQIKGMVELLKWQCTNSTSLDEKWVCVRDMGVLVLGYGCLLRRSELANLRVGDVTKDEGQRCFWVRVRRSKTDQAGAGVTLPLAWEVSSRIAVQQVVSSLLAQHSRWESDPDSMLLGNRGRRPGPVSKEQLGKIIKERVGEWAEWAGVAINLSTIGTHSLRRGGATALYEAGTSAVDIKRLGRWRSDCFIKYLEMSTQLQVAVSGKL